MSTPEKKPRNPKLRATILTVLKAQPDGMTGDEIAAKLGVDVKYVRPRITELKKANLIRDTGAKRRQVSGRPSTVVAAVAP